MDIFLSWLQHAVISAQHLFLSAGGREYLYLVFLLGVALAISTEQLRAPGRKLRNRHDREAWGQRPEPHQATKST